MGRRSRFSGGIGARNGGNRFAAFIIGIVFLNVLWTAGMNLLYGYTGLVSMMIAGSRASAHGTVKLFLDYGWSFWLAVPVAAIGAAAVGVILGLPSLRLRGFYFALSSLVIQVALTLVFIYFPQFTNGDTGITQIPRPQLALPGMGAVDHRPAFEIILGLLAVVGVAVVFIMIRSRMGAFIIAIREDDVLAEELGIDVTRYKVLAFFISSMLMAVGGAFYAAYIGFISPRSFDVLMSMNIWLMVAFGGRGTIAGPMVGSAILAPIPFLLQELYQIKDIFYGLLIILVTVAMPAASTAPFSIGGAHASARLRRRRLRSSGGRPNEQNPARRQASRETVRRHSGACLRGRAAGRGRDARHDRAERHRQDHLRQRGFRASVDRCRLDLLRRCADYPLPPARNHPGRVDAHLPGGARVRQIIRCRQSRTPVLAAGGGDGVSDNHAGEFIHWLDLDRRLDAIAGSLTLFEQRRLELLMRLVLRPKLVMLDEPVGGLSSLEITQMMQLLASSSRATLCSSSSTPCG